MALTCGIFLLYHLVGADYSGLSPHDSLVKPDLMFMNTEFTNSDIARITDYIDRVQPKQIAMVELNPELFEKIKKQGKYAYGYYYPHFVFSF